MQHRGARHSSIFAAAYSREKDRNQTGHPLPLHLATQRLLVLKCLLLIHMREFDISFLQNRVRHTRGFAIRDAPSGMLIRGSKERAKFLKAGVAWRCRWISCTSTISILQFHMSVTQSTMTVAIIWIVFDRDWTGTNTLKRWIRCKAEAGLIGSIRHLYRRE